MRPSLLQIRAIAGAIEGHLTLFTAALRADSAVHRRAKPLFLPLFTNCATQIELLIFDYFTAWFRSPEK
jgi:hypothetical protein